jgi:hypothetical protein
MVGFSISRISTEPFSGAKLTTAADFMAGVLDWCDWHY